MSTKLVNQGVDGVRRVGFYSDGTIAPVSLYIKDGLIQSHQQHYDIIETIETYRGANPNVTEFLRHTRQVGGSYLVLPEDETKALMAAELLPLLKDAFDFMRSRSAELHSQITDISNYILEWAVRQYDPERSTDIDELEYLLQPFWDSERAVNIEEVPPLDIHGGEFTYYPSNLVIHERRDGHYHIADCRNSSAFEDYLVPENSVGDVWLITYIQLPYRQSVEDLTITRIKG